MHIDDLCKTLLEDSQAKLAFFEAKPTSPLFFYHFYKSGVLNFSGYATPGIVEYIISVWDDVPKEFIIDLLKHNFNRRQSEFNCIEIKPILDKLSLEDIIQIEIPVSFIEKSRYLTGYLIKRFITPKEELLQNVVSRTLDIIGAGCFDY